MPVNEPTKIQTRSSTNRELYETINALIGGDKLDLTSLLGQKRPSSPINNMSKESTTNHQTAANCMLHESDTTTPASAIKSKTSLSVNRQRSVSFSTPEVREGFHRATTIPSHEGSDSPASPVRLRSHSSEAGSPTLEQALLMGRDSPGSDAGYGSFQSGTADLNSLTDLRRTECEDESLSPNSRPGDRSFSPGEPRPTIATLVEADLAVAQAVQNLQDLKERQQAIYQEAGVLNTNDAEKNILSVILSATQASRATETQAGNRAELKRDRLPLLESYVERDSLDRDYIVRDSQDRTRDPLALERAARQYRNAASIHEANCTWSGQLPPKQAAGRQPSYSSKIFLGGVPWDITENALIQAFIDFGPVRVEWPGREASSPPRGYLYIVFEDEDRVKELLAHCTHDFSNGGSYYFKISSKKRGSKEIQIIPWLVADSNYVRFPSPRLDPKKTVFVGALHGMINAQSLAVIFNDLFGGVVYAGLDTDKHKYPIGSGRVTFNNSKSYMKAVAAAFIEIKTPRFCKKVQVDPYLEDALCSMCHIKQGPYFCRDLNCFSYYCRSCWDQQHFNQLQHKPLMRNIRGLTRARLQDILPAVNDCYSPVYQGARESKPLSDLWGQDQDKRYDADNWRAACFEKPDTWRNTSFDRQNEAWRSPPQITWRNCEKNSDTWTHGDDLMWGDDFKLSSVFNDSLSFSSERKSGFRPFSPREPLRSIMTERDFFRINGDREPPGFTQDHRAMKREPNTYVTDQFLNRREQSSFHNLFETDQLSSLVDREQDALGTLMEKEKSSLHTLIDKDTDIQ